MRNVTSSTQSNPFPGPEAGSADSADRFPFQRLDVYLHARSLAALVHRLDIRDAELRDQATRAARSTFLNLCEGLPDDRPAMRRKYFAQADGSLHEAAGAVDLAAAIGAVAQHRADEVLAMELGASPRARSCPSTFTGPRAGSRGERAPGAPTSRARFAAGSRASPAGPTT